MTENVIPNINLTYDLANVADSIANWFGSFWAIVAFAVAIPLAFLIAGYVKNLFTN